MTFESIAQEYGFKRLEPNRYCQFWTAPNGAEAYVFLYDHADTEAVAVKAVNTNPKGLLPRTSPIRTLSLLSLKLAKIDLLRTTLDELVVQVNE